MAEYYVCNKDRDEHGGSMDGCMVWWRPEGKGYTYDLNHAGIFTEADMARNYPSPRTCHYLPKEIVDANTYSPRLAWWSRSRDLGPLAIVDALKLSAVSAPEKTSNSHLGSETPTQTAPPEESGTRSAPATEQAFSNKKAL